ncbi:unnamed protein product, partial [marine sediment metagenome]
MLGLSDSADFLGLARNVGDYVASLAERVDEGHRWRTISYDGAPEYSVEVFSGVSGIILFLADLYAVTGDHGYRVMAEGGARWVDCHARADDGGMGRSRGLYVGLSGHGTAFLHLARATGDRQWLALAAERADALQDSSYGTQEMMFGAAGIGLFLLKIHVDTGERRHLEEAVRAGEYLLDRAETVEGG